MYSQSPDQQLCTHLISLYVAKGTLILRMLVSRLIGSGLWVFLIRIPECKVSTDVVYSLKGLFMSEYF